MNTYNFVDRFGNFQTVAGTDFDVDSEGLYVYTNSVKTSFLEKGTYGAFCLNEDAPDLAGAWEEGFQAGRHTSESNKNPYKESK